MLIHRIPSWVIEYSDPEIPGKIVYSHEIMLAELARPVTAKVELRIQERVCVRDRQDEHADYVGVQCPYCLKEEKDQ